MSDNDTGPIIQPISMPVITYSHMLASDYDRKAADTKVRSVDALMRFMFSVEVPNT